jgi:hypothetical protein
LILGVLFLGGDGYFPILYENGENVDGIVGVGEGEGLDSCVVRFV